MLAVMVGTGAACSMANNVEGSLSKGVVLETQNHWWPRYLSRTADRRHIKGAVSAECLRSRPHEWLGDSQALPLKIARHAKYCS
jgi:hypothetical protein